MAQAAEAAVRQGLNELCITDHVDTLYWDDFRPRWDFDWDEARRQFREAQALWGDRITLRLGAELGDAQYGFDRAVHMMDGAPVDFVIGSVHLGGKKFGNMDLYYIEKVTKRIMIVSSTAIWTAFWSWPGGDSFRCWVI